MKIKIGFMSRQLHIFIVHRCISFVKHVDDEDEQENTDAEAGPGRADEIIIVALCFFLFLFPYVHDHLRNNGKQGQQVDIKGQPGTEMDLRKPYQGAESDHYTPHHCADAGTMKGILCFADHGIDERKAFLVAEFFIFHVVLLIV